MMNQHVELMIRRTQVEEAFLSRLLSEPKATMAELGVTLSDEECATFKALRPDEFQAFVAEYQSATDPAKRRAHC